MSSTRSVCALLLLASVEIFSSVRLTAQTPPILTNVSSGVLQFNLNFDPYPSVQNYTFLTTSNLSVPFAVNTNVTWVPYNLSTNYVTNGTAITTNVLASSEWRISNTPPPLYVSLQVSPIAASNVWAYNLLNRIAYGPSPDELNRVVTGTNPIGPAAFLYEQLNPETITNETLAFHTNIAFIQARLPEATTPINLYTTNSGNGVITTNVFASLPDLRAWHVLRGVGARRQLLEILLQFLENHFVTEYSKSQTYLEYALDGTTAAYVATQFEYLENERWRNALLNPQCTFYDLLKVSAESPAMIIYLDTVISRGNASNVANENFARELMELFTMGVDNGYDQTDVTVMSRCWAGWYVHKVDPTNAFNPFALPVVNEIYSNGVWALNYVTNYHNNNMKTNWAGKVVPARFGAPWAGAPYQLLIPARSGTNGMQDGYDVLTKIANLPFTEEYISICLCRVFVSDNFPNPSDDPADPLFPFYNYAGGNLAPEADLVHQCMLTWETNSPQGQIRLVLNTIFNSDLFKGTGSSMQKVKTPLEYTISGIRALRSSTNGSFLPGTFTADTDGYSISGNANGSTSYPLNRMGGMLLFDRQDPNGYPEAAAGWVSAGTLAERIRWMQTFCLGSNDATSKNDSISGGNKSVSNPVLLLQLNLPAASLTNAPAVADYFLGIFFPGEGAGNLGLYRAAAINFLNDGTADSPANSSPFSALTVSAAAGSNYDTRVRGVAAMLLGFQRFQEQ